MTSPTENPLRVSGQSEDDDKIEELLHPNDSCGCARCLPLNKGGQENGVAIGLNSQRRQAACTNNLFGSIQIARSITNQRRFTVQTCEQT